MATVSALRFYGKGHLQLDSVEPRKCGLFDVRVQVAYCGICGSDLHEYLSGPILAPAVGEKHPHTGAELPVVLGHEISGTIVEVGPSVTTVVPGQHCAINPSVDDRHHGTDACESCREGRPNLCRRWACYGLSALGGGLSDEIVVNIASVVPIPSSISLKTAALTEPLAVAAHMIRVSGCQRGSTTLVLGAGPIGLSLLLLLKAQGAKAVWVSEIVESRAEKARKFGADAVINPSKASSVKGEDAVVAFVRAMSENGVDIAFDAIGIQSTLDTAIAATKPGGTIFNVAIHEKPLVIHPNAFTLAEKRYMGGLCYTEEDFAMVVDAMASGTLPVEDLITSVVPLSKVVEGAFEELINNKDNHVKILVQPGK